MIKLDKKFGRVNYCHVCNSKKLSCVVKIGSTGLCDSLLTKKQLNKHNEKSYPLNLYRCKKCHLLQLVYIVNNKKDYHKKVEFPTICRICTRCRT